MASFLQRASEIAGLLHSNGVEPGDKVGVVLSRNLDLLPALVGILMCGAAYVPFLDTQPEKRILYMMENAEVKIILCDEHTSHSIAGLNLNSVDIKTPAEPLKQIFHNKMTDTIYVLYTSGSTGMPKGVQLPHRAISNLLECIKEIMVMNNGRVLCTTNITFDIFITESLLALAQGFCVVLADEETMVLPYKLAELIEEHDVRVMQYTPSRLHINMQNKRFLQALSQIECVIVVGENMPASTVKAFKEATTGQLFNMYGPTEAAVYVTQGELFASEEVNIGRPLNNCRLYIVDANMRVLPPTARGEICIAGICLADGYVGCDELTEKMFIKDAIVSGERMYRSGDIGSQGLDGIFQCFGRVDSQIKVNGMRLEPQEIIDAMVKVGAEHAAVYPLKNKDGTITLYGFVSPETLNKEHLKMELKQEIPAYMIPTEIFVLPAIPHNDSGKTDMKKLEFLIKNPGSQLEMKLEPVSIKELPSLNPLKTMPTEQIPLPVETQPSLSSGALSAEELLAIWEKTLGQSKLAQRTHLF